MLRYRYALRSRREVAKHQRLPAANGQPPRPFVEPDRIEVEPACLKIRYASTKSDQLPIPFQYLAMLTAFALVPIDLGSFERLRSLRIGNFRRIRKSCEFRPAAFANSLCDLSILMISEILKRTRR